MESWESQYFETSERLTKQGIDLKKVEDRLKNQKIETPSWGYGNSGTRFKVFKSTGAARNIYEKIADAAYIHKISGVSPSVALHIPWDIVSDWNHLIEFSDDLGIQIGAINPNLFQDDEYRLGSLCNPAKEIRKKAIDHMLTCCHLMEQTGSQILSVWLADGTNYAGQDNIAQRKQFLQEGLQQVYHALPSNSRMLIEYKFFEPAFYHTDLADWGMAYAMSLKLGSQAQVLVDTGHHAPGTNVAHIVSFLLDEQRLGGFHFNARQYADDDLIVGSTNPWELFVIFHELISAGSNAENVVYMIDQSHNIEPKLEAMLMSVLNCQSAYAKALLIDRPALQYAQNNGDVLSAHRILSEAFQTDVRPILMKIRHANNLPTDPMTVLRNGNYLQKVLTERGVEQDRSNGYPEA